jgi:hypothetical protein
MEYVQITYNHDDEFGGLYMVMGIDSTKYSEHKEGKEEHINLEETIKGLQKYVKICKVDNKRLMKAKEQQYDFNIKLMQILDTIENKMDNETESIMSRSCRYHDERRKPRSDDMHHHHSPKHSFRKARSISSPSSIRKHKRRIRVDELQG